MTTFPRPPLVALNPVKRPPATSWWLEHQDDRAAWMARADEEFQTRMQSSPMARTLHPRCVDDIK